MAIKADKLLDRPSELHRRYSGRLAMQKSLQDKMVGGASGGVVLSKKSITNIETMRTKVTQIEGILKGTLAVEKKELDNKKRLESGKRREKQEEKLETKPNAERGQMKMPSAPRLGILDWIKNFIGNILLGYFAVRLIDHLPKIMPIVKFLGSAADFIIDIGGKLLNGLVTFIDWGYKAYDATRGFMKNLGGENFAKGFDKFIGLVDNALFLTTVLAGSMALEALSGGDGGGLVDTGVDMVKDRLLQKGAAKAATSAAGKAGGLGVGAVAAIVAGAGLLASALGEGAFQVRKFAVRPIQKLENDQKSDKNPLTKIGRGVVLNMVRPLFGLFQTVGFLLDVVGAPFRYAIELLRFPFLSEEDKKKQATNLAKFDARIREDLRRALNFVTLGLAFKEKGSFGNIYGNKNAQKDMMSKMAGGGITRGGKKQGKVKRAMGTTTKKGKYKRVLKKRPIQPTQTRFKTTDKKVRQVSEDLDKTKYFGPILAVSSKIMEDEKPNKTDYKNVGLGLNLLIAKGIEDGQLKGGLVAAFAEGGMVDDEFLSAAEKGSDISNWIASTFNRLIESKVERNLRLIKERQEQRDKVEGGASSEDDSDGGGGGIIMGTSFEQGLAKLLRSYEGLRTAAYKDAVGVPTIGMGATYYPKGFRLSGNVKMGQTITEDEAIFIKMQHIKEHRDRLLRDISASEYAKVPDNVKAALESKTFNYGSLGSTLAGLVKEGIKTGNYKSVADYFRNTLSKHNGGINDWRRNDEAGLIETGASKRAKVSFPKSAGGQAIAEYQEKGGKSTDEPLSELPSGVKSGSMRTGPSQYIGGSSAYHIDTKFHKSLGMGNMVSAMDKLANAYSARGRKIEFSNAGVSGAVYDPNASSADKKSLLQRAIDAHAHSRFMRAEGFLPFDYYNPKKDDTRFGKSVEGSEILLPTFGGKVDVGTKYGGYGKSAEIFSGNKLVALTGHGDVRYADGGFVRGVTKAIMGERGVEFVLDNDTTRALEDNYPGFLKALNTADYKGALNVLRNYTDYASPDGGSTNVVMVPVPVPTPIPIGGGVGRGAVLGGSSGAPNPISEHMYRNS